MAFFCNQKDLTSLFVAIFASICEYMAAFAVKCQRKLVYLQWNKSQRLLNCMIWNCEAFRC